MSASTEHVSRPTSTAVPGAHYEVEVHGENVPAGKELLGSYRTYAEAQRVVDKLSDNKFPVRKASIIGRELAFVEQVTGRLTWGKVFVRGLGSGAVTGLFIGLILGLFLIDPVAWVWLLIYAAIAGAVIGSILALVAYGASGGHRDFDSYSSMTAGRFDVYVTADSIAEARRILG